MSVIGEAALSVFLEFLLDKLVSSRLKFVGDHKQVHNQLKEWQLKLPYIQAVLNDAEEKQMKDEGVKRWLADLQGLAYDVDDILDEFAYEALHLKLQKAQAQASTSKVRKLIPSCCTCSNFSPTSLLFNKKMISNIKEITDRLNSLTTLRGTLGLSEIMSGGACSKGKKPRLQPTSVMDETVEYVGRENEKREILELLKSCNEGGKHDVPVISIIGMGGMGKTTLAQLVYNDSSLNDSFSHKAWVCVSDDFDALTITEAILRSVTSESCDKNDLNLLQIMLKKKLSGTNFLLVLDDIWKVSYNDWSILRSPFGAGTKVIVTTRFQNVSSNVDAMKSFLLDKLSDDDCLSIFTQYALRAGDFNEHPELKEVGENIVKKCSGLPLAAKVIGRLLHTTKNLDSWEKISKSEIWELQEDQEDSSGIIPALRLSYYYLPPYLKRCFAYCSILPKNYEFEEEELVLLWRAEGLLQQNGENQIKNFENQCFRDLVSRSFFQISSHDNSRFIMHDLINDLAQSIAGEICSKLEGDKQHKFSSRTRHFCYIKSQFDGVQKFEGFDKMSSLRTFLSFKLLRKEVSYLTSFVLDDLLPRLKRLRVLSLNGYEINELPDFFLNLKHLRYVDFSETRIKFLPDSLCTLYHLETLILKECKELEKLPSKIGDLMELRYLDIRGAESIKGMPFGIGKLTNLQRLSDFILRKGDGHLVRELKNLSNLSGDFCMSGLENVKGQEAWPAMLKGKTGIDRLRLRWNANFDNDITNILSKYTRNKEEEERVLDLLHPQKKLEELIIENYGGTKLSAWIADSSFSNLLSLYLSNCENCRSLPSIGRLPALKRLLIIGFKEVNEVGVEFFGENEPNGFASLKTLCFKDMPNWKEWDPCEGDEHISKFPCLRELRIENCPQLLGRLPTHLPSLQKLEIYHCDRLLVSISCFPLLCELEIKGCKELLDTCFADTTSLQMVFLSNISKFSIPPERIMSRFTNLEYFKISGWKELVSLSQYGFGLLGHGSIIIDNCAKLVSLETEEMDKEKLQLEKISGIENLQIWNCERLSRLPKVLHALQFITEMNIINCPSLVCFAENDLPSTLKRLQILDCKNLKYLVDESKKNNSSNTCVLEVLVITTCPSLISLSSRADLTNRLQLLSISKCLKMTSLFSDAKLPMTLKQLQILVCPKLECITQDFEETTGLQSIKLISCDKIKLLPQGLDKLNHLQEIEIVDCSNFGAFPNCIYNLASLGKLRLSKCSIGISFPQKGFPTNLTTLEISGASKISRALVERGLHTLTSLQKLSISGEGCSDVVSFPKKEMMLPAFLIDITIANFENLEVLVSEGFQNLTSLQSLSIKDCPKLAALPKKDMLLSLGHLGIYYCPLLKENCKRGKGREWSKIAHIPFVQIDYETIMPRGI